ncbi:MAG: alpha/beta hydrolase [Pseudomonadales bacterium]|nr:alpha/beta hydrolase [Pseudomonadales bacterium]
MLVQKPLKALGGVLLSLIGSCAIFVWVSYSYKSAALLDSANTVQITDGVVQFVEHGAENKLSGHSVVILHGTPGGYDQFNHYGRLLADRGHHIVLPSRAGYLGTDASQSSLQQQATALAQLLDSLAVNEAVIVGISGGGPTALQFVTDYPQRSKGLVTVAAITDPSIDPLDPAEPLPDLSLSQSLLFYLLSFAPNLAAPAGSGLSELQIDNVQIAGTEMFQSLSFYELRKTGYQNDWQQLLQQQSDGQALGERLRALSLPTLAVHGEEDANVSIEHSFSLVEIVPGASLIAVPEATHLFLVTEINLIVDRIEDFLNSL